MNSKSKPKPSVLPRDETVDDNNAQMPKVLQPSIPSKAVSIPSPSPSRPKPVTFREDPMDRAQAFLTELPFLD
jgi:hypothetical protein